MMGQQRGVALLESLIAVVLLSIGVIGTMGLQARTVVAMSEAAMRAEATIAAERLIAQMQNDQSNLSAYAYGGVDTAPARLVPWLSETRKYIPEAKAVVTVAAPVINVANRRVGIVISWQRRGTATTSLNSHTVSAYVASAQ